jgi:hypothetical protein
MPEGRVRTSLGCLMPSQRDFKTNYQQNDHIQTTTNTDVRQNSVEQNRPADSSLFEKWHGKAEIYSDGRYRSKSGAGFSRSRFADVDWVRSALPV